MKLVRQLKFHCLSLSRRFRALAILLPGWKLPAAIGGACFGLFLVMSAFLYKSEKLVEEIDFGELPDFAAYSDVNQMKAVFFDYLQPMVEYHNTQIVEQRQTLQSIYQSLAESKKWRSSDQELFTSLASQYDYELDLGWNEDIDEDITSHPFNRAYLQLMLRVDEVPVDLALVQAAKESGWGRSRFAIEANNLFGQWCYTAGCGLVPSQRNDGTAHEVRKFESVAQAIGSYINNLNSHSSYETLRLIRGGLRSSGDSITGMPLADGLIYYSERREAYVDEVKVMIQQYHDFQNSRPAGS